MRKIHGHTTTIKMKFPDEIKEARVSELMEIQQNISSELNEKMIGKTYKVLIDRREGEFFIGQNRI